jgi:hypothetical protein
MLVNRGRRDYAAPGVTDVRDAALLRALWRMQRIGLAILAFRLRVACVSLGLHPESGVMR